MLKEKKSAFQLLEEFAVPYKAPKYTYKEASPELLTLIRDTLTAENERIDKRNKKVAIFASIMAVVLFRLIYMVTQEYSMVELFG